MPILSPEIQRVLRTAGLKKDNETIQEKLDSSGLGLTETLELLAEIAQTSTNESVRIRAAETVLKLHGVLKDQAPPPPSITIVINDGKDTPSTNPILLPRQLISTKETLQ
jgi:hypothetical protein